VSPDGVLRAQNRGQYLPQPFHGQFARLGPWLAAHEDKLFDALGTDLVAFGEWCAARHSLDYAALPDWWLLFDVYDRSTGRFWSTTRRNAWAARMGFATVPCLHAGPVDLDQLRERVHATHSQFRQGNLEGIVIRRENADWLEQRAKLVRADFTQTIEEHWRSRALEWNRVE
jgi:RNA ligase.